MENVNEAIFVIVTVLLLDHLYNNTFGLINILKTKEGFKIGDTVKSVGEKAIDEVGMQAGDLSKQASTIEIGRQVNKLTAIPRAIGKVVEKLNTKNCILCGLPGGIALFPVWLLLDFIKFILITTIVSLLYIPNMILSRGIIIVNAIYSSLKKLVTFKSNFKKEKDILKNEWKRSGNINKNIWKTYKNYVEMYEKDLIMLFLYLGTTAIITVPLFIVFITNLPAYLANLGKNLVKSAPKNFEIEEGNLANRFDKVKDLPYNTLGNAKKNLMNLLNPNLAHHNFYDKGWNQGWKATKEPLAPILGIIQVLFDKIITLPLGILFGPETSIGSRYRLTPYEMHLKKEKIDYWKNEMEKANIKSDMTGIRTTIKYLKTSQDSNLEKLKKTFGKGKYSSKKDTTSDISKSSKQKGGATLGYTLTNWTAILYISNKLLQKYAPLLYRLFFIYILLRIADIGIPKNFPKIVEKYIKKFANYLGFYNDNRLGSKTFFKISVLTVALLISVIIFPNPRVSKEQKDIISFCRKHIPAGPFLLPSVVELIAGISIIILLIIRYYKKSVTDCFDLYERIKDLAELFYDVTGKKKKKKSKLRETDEEKEARLAKEYEDALRNSRNGGSCKPDRDTVVYEKDGIDDNLDGSKFKTRFGKPWNLYPEDDKDKDNKEKRNKGTSKCEPNRDSVVYSNRGKYSGIMSKLNKIFSRKKDKDKDKDKDKKGKSYNCAPDRDSVVYTSKDDKISELEEELDETKRDLKKIRRNQANKATGKQRYNKEMKGRLTEHTHSEMDGSVIK